VLVGGVGDDEGLDSADVVIVGGGVMGASIAFHLTAAAVTDVLLLEANELGSGSSGKPLGGVRAQFSSPANVLLGARSLAAYRRFGLVPGAEIGLHQVGYLFLLRTRQDVSDFEASVAMQNDLGVPSRMISAEEARRLNPYLAAEPPTEPPSELAGGPALDDRDDVLAAAYSPQDGYAHPAAVVHGYAEAAVRRGARIRTGTRVTGIDVAAGQASVVHTQAGPIAARTVVCAAGAWSAGIGAMVGVDLPVQPLRRQIAFTAPIAPRPPRIPFTIDFDSTFYFHNSPDGLLLGMAEQGQPVGFETDYDERWLPELRAATARCAPDLAGLRLERGWAGLYEMTPDCNGLIGEAIGVSRFLYAAGFSGHGFLQAPAVGEIVRDLYLGVRPFCDVSGFDVRRFSQASARTELNII
jgi:sarcosine oxidase subunit beta